MKARKKLKILGLILVGIGLFCAGYACRSMRELITTLARPQIQSDYSIRQAIENKVGPPPVSATNLYFARNGFQDTDHFIAFNIDKGNCDEWLDDGFGIRGVSEQLKPLPKRVAERGPGSWENRFYDPRLKDPNWNLPANAQVIIYDDKKWTIVYYPEGKRLFMCLWGY